MLFSENINLFNQGSRTQQTDRTSSLWQYGAMHYSASRGKNVWTDQDAVWDAESSGSREREHVLHGGANAPHGKRHFNSINSITP